MPSHPFIPVLSFLLVHELTTIFTNKQLYNPSHPFSYPCTVPLLMHELTIQLSLVYSGTLYLFLYFLRPCKNCFEGVTDVIEI